MSEKSLSDIIGTTPSMYSGEWSNTYQRLNEEAKHQAVVTLVLELIKADVSASTNRTGYFLDSHLNSLETYVEQVKAQLDK